MRIFAATSRYVQGAGALDALGQHCRPLGSHAFIVTDTDMARLLGERVTASFQTAGLASELRVFPGEITHAAIAELAEQALAFGAQMIVGLGGGKALDTAKGVALKLGARSVSVPTIASNDGPASAAIAVYDENHIMQDILQLPRNPELVLVDSQIIANAPRALPARRYRRCHLEEVRSRGLCSGGRYHSTRYTSVTDRTDGGRSLLPSHPSARFGRHARRSGKAGRR
ncbi:iron-containing alcohol dehydrogenase [Pseudomonas aeruginosa]|nr:iron-containing alcohol dehydrogenase [Pseudomonas aeruginosa]